MKKSESANRRCARHLLMAVALTLVLWPSAHFIPVLAQDQPKEEFKVIPLRVNVLKDVRIEDENKNDVTNDTIDKIITEVNEILKQADIKLRFNFDKATDIKTNFEDGGDNDGEIDNEDEAKELAKKAINELNEKSKGKGYKVFITNKIFDKDTTFGHSFHEAFAFLKLRGPLRSDIKRSANDLAHEIGHSFGLSHVDSPVPLEKLRDLSSLTPEEVSRVEEAQKNLMFPIDTGIAGGARNTAR